MDLEIRKCDSWKPSGEFWYSVGPFVVDLCPFLFDQDYGRTRNTRNPVRSGYRGKRRSYKSKYLRLTKRGSWLKLLTRDNGSWSILTMFCIRLKNKRFYPTLFDVWYVTYERNLVRDCKIINRIPPVTTGQCGHTNYTQPTK